MVTILMASVKLANPTLLKIKIFRNKGYGITILGVTNKILSRDANHIIDVFMCPKFGNSTISIREVIITSML